MTEDVEEKLHWINQAISSDDANVCSELSCIDSRLDGILTALERIADALEARNASEF